MSKTYKNFVGLSEDANSMFVKIMEIDDSLILKYFEHCTPLYMEEIKVFEDRLNSGENPRNVKIDLALEIVKLYHGEEKAKEACVYFERVLKEGIVPDEKDIEKMEILVDNPSPALPLSLMEGEKSELPLVTVLVKAGLTSNSTEARNALSGNSVKVNNEVVTDPKFMIKLDKINYTLLQVGKKKFKMVR